MMRPIYLIFKIGNNGVHQSRALVDYYDPLEWGHTEQQELNHFSDWNNTVYYVVRWWDRSAPYKTWMEPKGRLIKTGLCDEFDTSDSDFRQTSMLLDFDKVAVKIQDPDLRSKLSSPNPVEILDSTNSEIDLSFLKDSGTTPREDLKDFNAISSGSHTIGSGKDYATAALFFADLTTFTGNITGTCYGTTETGQITSSANRSTYTLDFIASANHGGDVTSAITVSSSYQANHAVRLNLSGSGVCTIDNLRFNQTANPSASRFIVQAVTTNHTIKNSYFDSQGHANSSGVYAVLTGSDGAIIANNVAWDGRIGFAADELDSTVDNCTAYNHSLYGYYGGNSAGIIRSCIGFDGTTSDYNTIGSKTRNNLASSDTTATGTDPQTNLTASDEIYTDDTAANFAHPKEGSTVATNGNTTHVESTDAAGVTWDGSDPSIGAFQYVSGLTVSPYYYQNLLAS